MTEPNYDEHVGKTRICMSLLNSWGVEPVDQIAILGLPLDTKPRALNRYRSGTPLPEDDETRGRMDCLVRIQASLELAFPHNETMANYWVTTECPQFDNVTPLDIMLKNGLDGMHTVAGFLDHSDSWW